MTKTDWQRGDVVLLADTTSARVLRVYTLSWCAGASARTCTLLTVRAATGDVLTVDASQVRALSQGQTVRTSRLGWTRAWWPSAAKEKTGRA